MRPYIFLYTLCMFLVGCDDLESVQAELSSVSSFGEMQQALYRFDKDGINHTLVVMDNDDTLTMMTCTEPTKPEKCQYLGGPAWYAWQSELIKNQDSSYRVADNSKQLLAISTLLLAINKMPYTDEAIPDVLNTLVGQGAKLLVLTARGVSNVAATEDQFSVLSARNQKHQDFLTFIRSHGLKGNLSGIASIAGPITPVECDASRPIAYQQGIMYASGQNKGNMLRCLLGKTQSGNIKNILFIDDTLKNVQDVYTAFEGSDDYRVLALHYTRLSRHKQRLTEESDGEQENKFQRMAHARWSAIKGTLQHKLIDSAIPETSE